MAKREKFEIYLAGPITGCNEEQLRRWRDDVTAKYTKDFSFIDPTRRWEGNAIGEDKTPLEIVQADLRGIERADGMLVNMWRESIGTSIGMVHAHRAGKPVVVADPNHLHSQMLAFYADALEDNPLKAAAALRALLRAERWHVDKAGGRPSEPFQRSKLVSSIGAACADAGRNDVVVPRMVLPHVLERLKRRKIGDQITTSDIHKAVYRTFEQFAKDDSHRSMVEGVLEVWPEARPSTRDSALAAAAAESPPHPASKVSVRVYSPKSHGTIWGKGVRQLSDIPSDAARRVFETIIRTPGITEVVMGPFGQGETRKRVCATVAESPTPNVLEGKIFDQGVKGSFQTFQVWVQDDAQKARIKVQCQAALQAEDLWAG